MEWEAIITAIIGYGDGKHVWIGGDSAAQNGHYSRITIHERKVFRLGEALVGGAGLLRPLQVIRTGVEFSKSDPDVCGLDYLITVLVPAMQAALASVDVKMIDDDGNQTSLMIGYRGVLYCMGADFSIRAHDAQMYGLGNGGDLALGALQICLDFGMQPDVAILSALEASAKFDLTVSAPHYVECI